MSPINTLVEITWKRIEKDVFNHRFSPQTINTASILMSIFMDNESMQKELDEIFTNLSEYLHAWEILPMKNSRSLLDSIKSLVMSLDEDLYGTRPQDMSSESIVATAKRLELYARSLARMAARI
jgi:hypothetical protein